MATEKEMQEYEKAINDQTNLKEFDEKIKQAKEKKLKRDIVKEKKKNIDKYLEEQKEVFTQKGLALVPEEKAEAWKSFVEENVNFIVEEGLVKDTLDVIEALEAGVNFDKVADMIDQKLKENELHEEMQGHSGSPLSIMMKGALNFSSKGPEFLKEVAPDSLNKPKVKEEYQRVIEENEKIAKKNIQLNND